MPATVTLSTTTLAVSVGVSDTRIKVGSTSGLTPGTRLYVDGEQMRFVSVDVDPWINVRRGVDGTASAAHPSSATVYIGRADQFYSIDPTGRPPDVIPVSPYINVINGSVWFAQGDSQPDGQANRWWQKVTNTYGTGALGVRTTTQDPTAST
jgi:hypothetical protein